VPPTPHSSPAGLVFKALRLVYHSTLGWRVIKKKKKNFRFYREWEVPDPGGEEGEEVSERGCGQAFPPTGYVLLGAAREVKHGSHNLWSVCGNCWPLLTSRFGGFLAFQRA